MSQSIRPRVLVLDDDQSLTELLSDLLETEGYKTVVFNSSKDVLYMARQFLPDVLLLDIMMPEIDGYDVCRYFKSDPELQRTRIVVLTARDSLASRLDCYRAGADQFLSKPFDLEELRLVIAANVRAKKNWEGTILDARKKSMVDSIAQCYSWRYMQSRVHDEIKRVDRHEHPLSLILLELDRFPQVNARYGFDFGNKVIKSVVEAVRAAIRESDIVGRYQHDAFLVILPETPLQGAKAAVTRIQEQLEKLSFPERKRFSVQATIIQNTVTNGKKPEVVLANLEERLRRAQHKKA